jgi:hypothetical protein
MVHLYGEMPGCCAKRLIRNAAVTDRTPLGVAQLTGINPDAETVQGQIGVTYGRDDNAGSPDHV